MTLSAKEKFSGAVSLLLGLFYLLSEAWRIFIYSQREYASGFSSTFFMTHFKMIILAGLAVLGGLLLFRKNNYGWIICTAILLQAELLAFMSMMNTFEYGFNNPFLFLPTLLFVQFLFSFAFLFPTTTRKKFLVNNRSYLFHLDFIYCS